MKKSSQTAHSMLPKRIRTYLFLNVTLAVSMSVVLAVRSELRSGRHNLIDVGLLIVFALSLGLFVFGPLSLVERYLSRRKKGVWYAWRHGIGRRRDDEILSPEERRSRKSEAVRARLLKGMGAEPEHRHRTRLFEGENAAEAVSRAALLMTVADKFERTGKRDAAVRCYRQIQERFPDSPEASDAVSRLAAVTER
jgi:hypothetical protein